MTDQPSTAETVPALTVPVPSAPTLADQVAAVDAVEVAARIVARGSRAAIGASTIEIVAMAKRVMTLTTLADLTFQMLEAADRVQAEPDLEARKPLRRAFKQQVDLVGVSLEALGYGQPETTSNEEKIDGQG